MLVWSLLQLKVTVNVVILALFSNKRFAVIYWFGTDKLYILLLYDKLVSTNSSVPFIILYLRVFLIYFNLYCSWSSDHAILKRQFLIIYVIQVLFSGTASPPWHLIRYYFCEYYIKYANIFPPSYLQHTLNYLRNWGDKIIVFYLNYLYKNSPAILNIYIESVFFYLPWFWTDSLLMNQQKAKWRA